MDNHSTSQDMFCQKYFLTWRFHWNKGFRKLQIFQILRCIHSWNFEIGNLLFSLSFFIGMLYLQYSGRRRRNELKRAEVLANQGQRSEQINQSWSSTLTYQPIMEQSANKSSNHGEVHLRIIQSWSSLLRIIQSWSSLRTNQPIMHHSDNIKCLQINSGHFSWFWNQFLYISLKHW